MYTPVQICNLALARIGNEAAQISSIPVAPAEKYSKEANLCSKFIRPALLETLRIHTWNFAKKRAALSKFSDAPAFGFTNKFALPADCVRPLECRDSASSERRLRFSVEWVVEGRTILSNAEALYMLYIGEPEDFSAADSLFIKAFYMNLAAKICYPLTEDRVLLNDILTEIEQVIMPEARRVNSFEGSEFPVIDSEWLEAGYVGTDGFETGNRSFQSGYGSF